jgi:parvulin-like peptidyl-prolyl isomerase
MKKILVALLMLAIAGCAHMASKRTSERQVSVATVDGRSITVAKLDSTIRQLEKNSNTTIANDDPVYVDSLKRIALDSLINHRLIEIREDSIKMVLNNDWEFNQKRLDEVNQAIMKVLFDKEIVPRVKFDSSEVVKYYNEHPDQYMESEKVSAKHILIRRPKPDTAGVTSEKKRKKILDDSEKFAKDRADAVLKKALAGENWDTLAATYSEDANNSKKGGDLGYFIRGRMQPEFDSAAFAATPGSIVGPIPTRFGYHIIKVDDHKQATPKEFNADLWEQIHAQLMDTEQKKVATQYLDSLKANSVTAYNEPMLATPDSLINDQTWIMTVNGNDTLFERTVKQNILKYQRWKQLDSITVNDKKDMLVMMAPTYLLRSAAKNLGLMNEPAIINTSDEFTTSEARSRMINYLQNTEYEPSDKEIEDYYNANIDAYKEKRPLQVYHILFQDSLQAEAVRDSILAGADFGEMAKRYYPGDPEIREVLYNLDYIGPQEMGLEFFQTADSMKVGEVSHPVKSQWGYHIIKLVNRKEDRTLAQVIPGIKQHLKDERNAEKTEALVAAWRQGAVIKVDEKAFKKFKPEEKKVIRIESTGQAGS